MVKVWMEKEAWLGRVFDRINNAYKQYAPPEIEFTSREDADLFVIHYLGKGQERDFEKPYVLIVHDQPWREFLQTAVMVSTFHPIDNALILPWGVDECFTWPTTPVEKIWQVIATGYVSSTEWIKDAYLATMEFDDLPFLHIGGNIGLDDCIMYVRKENVTDFELVRYYQQSRFVNAVRITAPRALGGGFEIPAIEGLACGARPICVDKKGYYRPWFGDHAVYIRDQYSYLGVFENYVPVTEAESAQIKQEFAWKNSVDKFWSEVLKNL